MRKLATAAAVSLALTSGGAFGLGLGDIEMTSALNQPMNAEIELTSVQPGELEGLIVKLASAEAFDRAGIERTSVLTDLRFTVDQSAGQPVIRVSSNSPIVEPFLNFLVEVDWPQGTMVREYTVLLDPPVFLSPSASERNTASDQPALVQGGESALVVPTPIQRENAELEQGLEVGLSDLEDAAVDPVLTLDEASEGELVSLDSLTDVPAVDPQNGIASGDGDIVSLSDLGAPNTDALAQREALTGENFDLSSIQVGGADNVDEITDDVVFGSDGQPLIASDSDDGSTIVSLDALEEPAQITGGNGTSEITVGRGDTLFQIAQDNTPSGSTVQQMMMAMLAANESAFINNNINLVRAGSILRVPEANEVNTLTQAQALAAIGEQNQLWQDYRDNLRAQAGTQVAQNLAPEATATADQANNTTQADGDVDEASTLAGLSDEARAILDSAREEVLDREELRIVADNAPSSTTASATADESTEDNDAARIGEVNRRLQLAREELAATRLLTTDLDDQAGELENTTENLDAMVTLRQNEIARLEAQLADASDRVEEAESAAEDVLADAGNAISEAGDTVSEAAGGAIDAGAESLSNAAESAQDAAAGVVDSGSNALTEAGESLGEVQLFDENEDTAEQAEDVAANTQNAEESTEEGAATSTSEALPWYQSVLDDPKRLAIVGVGALGLLGVLGTLLFRRKRREPEESSFDGFDESEFHDTAPEATAAAGASASRLDETEEFNAAGAVGAAGVAGAAAVGGIASGFDNQSDEALDAMDESFANSMGSHDAKPDFPVEEQAPILAGHDAEQAIKPESLDKDDTISEVDVYLAYGLHGQAEELLVKAVERKPDNEDYAHKLLQTYHAQGNSKAFHASATDYHQRFGGEQNPQWQGVAAMGAELRPSDSLYASGLSSVAKVASGGSGEFVLDDDDFSAALSNSDGGSSVSRGFSGAAAAGAAAVGVAAASFADDGVDESALMDESLDPALMFNEADLEATGDFSAIAQDLANENGLGEAASGLVDDGSIDFPNFDDIADSTASDTLDELSETAALDPLSEDALSLDELNGLSDSVDDLTLDIDQLSGDMELDSSELLNGDLTELDLPDLSSDGDLTLDSSAALGDSANEMDTMMDLAKAYIDMGDKDSASSALGEIVKSGNPEQVNEAETLLRNIS